MSGLNRMPTASSCTDSTVRGLTALLVSNYHPWSSWRNLRRLCPCRVPTWCATAAVWRRTASCGRQSFPHRANRVSTASTRSQEPRTGIGRGCWVVSLIWIWQPVFRHCVGGGKRADALRRRSRARPCDLYPGVGDDPYFTPSQAGLRSASHCSGPPSPRAMCVRRSPRQRGPVGDVRAAAVYFPSLRFEFPFEILPPQRLQTEGRKALATGKPVRLSRNPS